MRRVARLRIGPDQPAPGLPELAAAGAHRANILMSSQPGNAPFPTEDVTFSLTLRPLLGVMRIPVPKPVRKANHFNLEALKPETPKIALYVVLALGRLTLQVVWLGLAHFQLPIRLPISPFPPDKRERRQAVRGWSGWWIVPDGKVGYRLASTLCRLPRRGSLPAHSINSL